MGRLDEAQEHYEADLALRRRLVARDAENQRWREFLGIAHEYLGNLLATRGETAAARPHLEAARDSFDRLAARDPSNGDWRNKQGWSYLWLGRLEHAEGHLEQARADWHRAGGIAQELVRTDPERANWRQLLGVALYHVALGQAEVAPRAERSQLLQAVSVLERCVEEQPNDRRNRRWLAEALLLRGDLATGGDRPAAEAAWRRAAEVLRPLVAGGTRDASLLAPWVRTLDRLGRPGEAAEVRAALDAMGVPGRGAIP
jgi:tetratricopeptide (TPR) repeat protein